MNAFLRILKGEAPFFLMSGATKDFLWGHRALEWGAPFLIRILQGMIKGFEETLRGVRVGAISFQVFLRILEGRDPLMFDGGRH